MGIQMKLPTEKADQYVNDKREATYYEDFSKRWVIATERLLPYLNGEKKVVKRRKGCNTNFRRTSHTFTYIGGKNG